MLGSNCIETVQAPPATRVAGAMGQVVADWMKSPLNRRLLIRSAVAAWALVMVMVWKALVVPTGTVKLVINPGRTVTGALPGPVRLTVCGFPAPSSAILSVAVLVPD